MYADIQDPIEREQLQAVEDQIDQWRAGIPLPPWGRARTRWTLLSVCEDGLRLLLLKVQTGDMELDQYNVWLDNYKFMLKHALAHASSLPEEVLKARPLINNEEWGIAHDLLENHASYDHACAAFSGAKAGIVRCLKQHDGAYWFQNAKGSFERQANDILESRSVAINSPVMVLLKYLFAQDDLTSAMRELIERTRTTGDPRRPRIDQTVFDEFDSMLGHGRSVIPSSWRSSLGTAAQLSRTIRNLKLCGLCHLLAVSGASIGRKGIGVQALLGQYTSKWLIRAMSMQGGVSADQAQRLISLWTYGQGTRHPDPALQFMFELHDGLIAIPWFLFVTCNTERNFLTLLARICREEFDAASAAFEAAMIADVRKAVSGRAWRVRFNRGIPGEAKAGEVDVVLMNEYERFALVCELRWFLEPSEVSEVSRRESEGERKGQQARTKASALVRAMAAVCAEEGFRETREWQVDAVAIFDNYLPTPSTDLDVPFVSHRAFLSSIARHQNLRELVVRIRSGAWLPQAKHFSVEQSEEDVGGTRIIVDALNPTEEGYEFIFERDDGILKFWNVLS